MRRLRHLVHRRDVQLGLVAAILMAAGLVMMPGGRAALAAIVAGDRESARTALLALGPLAPVASVVLNVVQGVLAPIPGFVVPYVNGVVFGAMWGGLLSWIGGIGAASACFAIARTFGRGFAERMCRSHTTLDHANRVLRDHGLWAVVLARLLPGMPFDAFSYLGGLTRVRFSQFVVGTAIGSAPHAYLYAVVGEYLDVPMWLGLVATPLLGLLTAGVHLAVRGVRRRRILTPVIQPISPARAYRAVADAGSV